MSNQTYIDVNRRDVATFIASKLAPMAVPTIQLRNDLANIQIDHVILVENYNEIPSIQFKLDLLEGMGVELLVRLAEFATNPTGYMRNLLENMQGIKHAALNRRNGRQAEVSQMFRQMGGAQ